MANTVLSDGDSQPLSSRDATPAAEHTLWGSPALPTVGQLAAGSLLSPQWPDPWVPAVPPTLESQDRFGQRLVSASYYPSTSFPTPALFVETEPHQFFGFAPHADDGNPPLAARQEDGYGNGTSNSRSAYQSSAEAPKGPGSLGDMSTPKFDQLGYFLANAMADGHQTPTGVPHPVPTDSGAAQPQIRDREPVRLHSLVVGQPHNGVRIKKEPWEKLDHGGWDGLGWVQPEMQKTLSAHGTENAPKSGYDPDEEGSFDRKKRGRGRRFREGERMETSNTRTMGACLRCHAQRVRVSDGLVWIVSGNPQN